MKSKSDVPTQLYWVKAPFGASAHDTRISPEDIVYTRADLVCQGDAVPEAKCVYCEHESLFSVGTRFCCKPVRRESSKHKSTAETHADDFKACNCKCVFAPTPPAVPAEEERVLFDAVEMENFSAERVQQLAQRVSDFIDAARRDGKLSAEWNEADKTKLVTMILSSEVQQ